jgi:hypothetical protein
MTHTYSTYERQLAAKYRNLPSAYRHRERRAFWRGFTTCALISLSLVILLRLIH